MEKNSIKKEQSVYAQTDIIVMDKSVYNATQNAKLALTEILVKLV